MKKTRPFVNALAFTLFTLAFGVLAQAQATRTWVSGVGDDVNPCSRTAPCKTFAGAISKTADGGEINAIDPGGYGTITITKGITIDGGGTFASILAAGTNGVIVNETTNTKTIQLRNLSINGAGTGVNGIRYLAGKTLHVENLIIFGFTNHGIDVNLVNAGELMVENTTIKECAQNGINTVTTTAQIAISINNVVTKKCSTGLRFSNGSRAIVRDSLSTQNSSAGLTADQTTLSTEVNVEHSVFTLSGSGVSGGGIQAGGGAAHVRISNCLVAQNISAFVFAGGTVDTGGNNRVFGNGTNNSPNGISFGPV